MNRQRRSRTCCCNTPALFIPAAWLWNGWCAPQKLGLPDTNALAFDPTSEFANRNTSPRKSGDEEKIQLLLGHIQYRSHLGAVPSIHNANSGGSFGHLPRSEEQPGRYQHFWRRRRKRGPWATGKEPLKSLLLKV